jgi:hypothetical protein
MDANDPEERIRELERRLTEAHDSPRDPYQAAPARGTFPPPSPGWYPPPAGTGLPDYSALRHQMNRRHRLSGFWAIFIVPGILMILVLVFHLYR